MIVRQICTMKTAVTTAIIGDPFQPPKNRNPGIVPPWLRCPDNPRIMRKESRNA